MGPDIHTLHDTPPDISKCKARCPENRAIVEMLKAPEKIGSLYIPTTAMVTHEDDEGSEMIAGMEPSIGILLADATQEKNGQVVESYKKGELVCVWDGDGVVIEDVKLGAYRASNEVRMYGLTMVKDKIEPVELPLDESIVCTWNGNIERMTGSNILIHRKGRKKESEGGIILPDSELETGACMGEVVMVGPLVKDVPVGSTVLYHPLYKQDVIGQPDKRIIRRAAIQAIIE